LVTGTNPAGAPERSMSHRRNSRRRIKYFYTVAFLSVWKKIPLERQARSGFVVFARRV
jgi:hypothetical protein